MNSPPWTGVTPGDGPQFHLISSWITAGARSTDPIGRQALACIRCGSCMNICGLPAYLRPRLRLRLPGPHRRSSPTQLTQGLAGDDRCAHPLAFRLPSCVARGGGLPVRSLSRRSSSTCERTVDVKKRHACVCEKKKEEKETTTTSCPTCGTSLGVATPTRHVGHSTLWEMAGTGTATRLFAKKRLPSAHTVPSLAERDPPFAQQILLIDQLDYCYMTMSDDWCAASL